MSEAKRILSETALKRSKTIQEFREETILKSPAVLSAEIIANLARLQQLARIAEVPEGVRHEK